MNENQHQRQRTITWEDPKVTARNAMSLSGLDFLRSIKDGKIKPPPAAMLLGYRIAEIDFGCAVFELDPAEFHYNPFASVHGGIISALLDTAMTSAILSTLPIGASCSTLEMKVNFVRPITSETGIVRAEGRVIHNGSRIAIAEGKLKSADDKLCAYAVNTCMIFHSDQKA